jgi:hypothetical protein
MMAELREAIEAAMESEEAASAATPETPPENANATDTVETTTPDAKTDVVEETPSGAEAKPEQEGEAGAKPAPADAPTGKVETPAEAEARVAKSRVDRAPASWKGDVKGEWANLPLHVRQEIHRREAQVNKTMEEASTYREISGAFEKIFTPHLQRVQSYGSNPIQMVDSLLQTEATLAGGSMQQKATTIANLIQQYGIDLQTLDTVLSASLNNTPQQPDIATELEQRLMQKFQPILQTVQSFQEQQRQNDQRLQQEAVTTVEQMALDPRFPYFDEVRNDMADVMEIMAKRGTPISLEDAYKRATAMNGFVANQISSQSANQAAKRAKEAAVSVSSNPASGGSTVAGDDGTLRGAIEAAFGANRV